MDDPDEPVQKMLKRLQDLLANPDKPCSDCRLRSDHPGRSTKYGWTDEIHLTKGLKYCVWKPIPEAQVYGHLIDFIVFWCSGHVARVTDIFPLIRNVLLMMPVGISRQLLLKDVFDSAIETAQTPPAVDSPQITYLREIYVPDSGRSNSESSAARVRFFRWLLIRLLMLRKWRTKALENETYLKMSIHVSRELRLVLGFCALILIRLMITKEYKVKEYLQSSGTTAAFKSLFPTVDLTVRLVPPNPHSLKMAAKAFREDRNGLSKQLLQLVIFQYVKSSMNPDASSGLTKQILEEGCLKAMECNGMGLVTMFYDVVRMFPQIEDRQLLKIIGTDPELDGESCKRLVKIMDVYFHGDKPEYSWKWARILSPDYFSDLNIRRNRTFCQKLALLLVRTNSHIFQHKDMKNTCFEICYNHQSNASGRKWAESTLTSLQEINDGEKVCPQS